MATIVPVSLGGTSANTAANARFNLGFADMNVHTYVDNVTIANTTIKGLTLEDFSNNNPVFVNANLHFGENTIMNGSPAIEGPTLYNASISTGGLTFLTTAGNAFITTARMIHSTAYTDNTFFPAPDTYNGYFATDHAHSAAFFSDAYKYNRILTANSTIEPDRNFGSYEVDPDIGRTVLKSFMDVGTEDRQVRNINMYGEIRNANVVNITERLTVGDNGFRYIANDEVGDQVIIGEGGILDNIQFQINGNVRINGNLIITGSTLEQDAFADIVQDNLTFYSATANANINKVQTNVHHLGSTVNTEINTISGNLASFALRSNANVNIVQGNLHHLGTTVNSHSDTLQSNLDYFATTANTNINTVQDNVEAVHSGNQNFTVEKTFEDDVIVRGNLSVQGTTTSINATNLEIDDPFITLANNITGTPTQDGGLLFNRGTSANAGIVWVESADAWVFMQGNGLHGGLNSGSLAAADAYTTIYTGTISSQSGSIQGPLLIAGSSGIRDQSSFNNAVVFTSSDSTGQLSYSSGLLYNGSTLTVANTQINAGVLDNVYLGNNAPVIAVDLVQQGGTISGADVTIGAAKTLDVDGTVDIDATSGSNMDGVTIGATDPKDGTFVLATVNDDLTVTGNVTIGHATASTTKDTGALIIQNGGLGVEGAIHAGGDVSAFNTSDYRLKHNVKTIDSALDKVAQIKGVEFDWDASEAGLHYGHLKGHDVGVIAQDLKEILPEAVTQREDGYLAVDYGRVVPLLIQAIKELKDKIEDK